MDILLTPVFCLALNIYFEARSEPRVGQIAVSQVVLNRVESEKFPDNICSVIKQPKHFSWYWDGKSDKPKDAQAWAEAVTVASLVYRYEMEDVTDGSLYYHATWLPEIHHHPEAIVYGEHVFFKKLEYLD